VSGDPHVHLPTFPPTTPRDHATRAHSSGKLPRVYKVDVPDGGPRPHTAATRPLNHNKLNPREGPLARVPLTLTSRVHTYPPTKSGGPLVRRYPAGKTLNKIETPQPCSTREGSAKTSHPTHSIFCCCGMEALTPWIDKTPKGQIKLSPKLARNSNDSNEF